MKKIRILCYGDSNTWGFVPAGNHKRYKESERWTKILSKKIGSKYEIIEEGLSGRTLNIDNDSDPSEGKNGYLYLVPCLKTHDPIDLVILMLGTNELKTINNKSAEDIGNMLEEYYVKTILNQINRSEGTYPKLLIMAPPLVMEEKPECKSWNNFVGAYQKSVELNDVYKSIAKKYNCYFLSNKELETGIDGIHLTKESHKLLAQKLEKFIRGIYDL